MYRNLHIAVVLPCYNEEKLITKTIQTMPIIVDTIIAVNDGSKDNTLKVLKNIAKKDARVIIVNNEKNCGVGYSLVNGFKVALSNASIDLIGVMAGDAQCDPNYIKPMIKELIDNKLDYVKANRFFHRDALKTMPTYRKVGNIFISLLTKFSTGYYSISDTQNGYGFFTRRIMEKMEFSYIGERYDYENSLLIALSIANAKIKDYAVPAIYGDETSTIKFLPVAFKALKAIWVGFWKRIYYKYVLYSFHPIALFLFSSIFLTLIGVIAALVILFIRITTGMSPSAATVMLVVLPLIVGFQLFMSYVIIDMNNENRN